MKFLLAVSLMLAAPLTAATNTDKEKKENWPKVVDHLSKNTDYDYVLAAEGEFVLRFNRQFDNFIKNKMTKQSLTELKKELKNSLNIPLTKKGFVNAALRDTNGENDTTNYDAIWVRDSAWIYFSMIHGYKDSIKARTIMLALWDYYSSAEQLARFDAVTKNPKLALDSMAVPHIRFDGNSKNLGDVMVNGQVQRWNHRQIDAHALFLLALNDAFERKLIVTKDLTKPRLKALGKFPGFFSAIKYWSYEDSGAWEEIERRNTSSIAVVSQAMYRFSKWSSKKGEIFDTLNSWRRKQGKYWKSKTLKKLHRRGLKTVKYQLKLGGESPDYKNTSSAKFRRADVALMNVVIPEPLHGLKERDYRHVANIIETLKRPAGILRYENDSYQSGNYWIRDPKSKKTAVKVSANSSSAENFAKRFSALIPNTEAQWFFDSKLSWLRLELAKMTKDPAQSRIDRKLAALHLKRAVGQITGKNQITADGKPVAEMLVPESINTVVIDGKQHLLASPITPLNWAKAGLKIAIQKNIELNTP